MYDEVDELLEERERFWPDADPCRSAVGAHIIRIARYLDEDRATRLEQFGVTPVEFDVLMVLRHFGGDKAAMRPSQIADKLLLSRTRTTVRVDGLVDRHLVDRFEDPSNRRQVGVQLSPLGHDLLDRAFGAYQGGLQELLGPMPKAATTNSSISCAGSWRGPRTGAPQWRALRGDRLLIPRLASVRIAGHLPPGWLLGPPRAARPGVLLAPIAD